MNKLVVESTSELIKLIVKKLMNNSSNDFQFALFMALIFLIFIFLIILAIDVIIFLRAKKIC